MARHCWKLDLQPNHIKDTIINHFKNIYTTDLIKCEWTNPTTCKNVISMEDRTSMGRPLEKDEIKNAIYSFKPLKSPRPDGLHPLFFQKYWSDIEESVVNTGMKIFSSCTIPPELSKTFICLISKIKNLEQITHYRPNSLCITIYETITKVLVNRIRPYLDSIICPQQCSFILGRRVVDNAIIVQEAIHSFQKTKGKCGKMMLKIDL